MTRTGIDCGLGKTLQQEPNARGINSREPCAITGFCAGVDAMIATHGLTHLALSLRDSERSLRFYSSVFWVREYFRDSDTIQVLGPGSHDVIAFERRPEDAGSPGGIIHVGFRLTRKTLTPPWPPLRTRVGRSAREVSLVRDYHSLSFVIQADTRSRSGSSSVSSNHQLERAVMGQRRCAASALRYLAPRRTGRLCGRLLNLVVRRRHQ
jgi:hypothetical protein